MMGAGLEAHLQGFTLYTLHLQYIVAVFQMRGLSRFFVL